MILVTELVFHPPIEEEPPLLNTGDGPFEVLNAEINLSNWTVTGITNATDFMANASGLSTTNYDSTLSGWHSQAVQNGVNIHFGSSQYSTATGLAYRNALVASGWTITDGGAV